MKRLFLILILLGLAGLGAFWGLTAPRTLPEGAMDGLSGDPARGERIFTAGGCASCHAAPGAEGEARRVLAGGRAFKTDFGTFYAPNISPSPEHGIGGWSALDLANALRHGTSPEGQHYYPAFPYTSYVHMELADIADLHAFLQTLPASDTPNRAHDVGFPFNIRRTLGGWKLLFLREDWVIAGDLSPEELRGRYLVEALGHCGECHTPRNTLGGWKRDRWLAGGPNPDGKGRIPNITPHPDGIGAWSTLDIVTYLNSGFTPEYDVAGGSMAEVIENTRQLPPEDHAAIAAYLKRVPPLPSER